MNGLDQREGGIGGTLLWVLALCMCLSSGVEAGDLKVVIGDAPDKCAPLLVAVYDSEDTFLTRPAYSGKTDQAKDATVEFTSLKPGRYAVSAFCDNNQNGELDMGPMYRPLEPTAISDGITTRREPPQFGRAAFTLGEGTHIVRLKLH